jgi:hypothetical protein
MSARTPQAGRTARPPPDIPPLHPLSLDARVEVSGDTVRPATSAPEPEAQPYETVLRQVTEELVRALCAPVPGQDAVVAVNRLGHSILLRFGYRDIMQRLDRPPNAAKLVPAFDDLIKARALLAQKVPAVVEDIDLAAGQVDRDQLVLLRDLQQAVEVLVYGLAVLISRQEVRLDWLVRQAFDLSAKEIERSYDLTRQTARLLEFAKGPAQQGVETREANTRLRERTEVATLDRVKEALHKAAPAAAGTPPGPGPGTAPPARPADLPDLPAPKPKGRPRASGPRGTRR